MNDTAQQPIGVFDSGVGGLSVLQALRAELPHERFVYVADSGHAPYGERGDAYVAARTHAISDFLCAQHHIKALVVACNTATAAAIHEARVRHPQLPLVGVEPALKPAVAATRTVAVVSLLALIVLCLAWELVLAPVRPGGSWLALKALPLCIPLAGLLKNRMYTYRWLSLMVWLYVMEGAVRAWSDRAPSNWLALLEVLLCIVLFTACSLHVRLRLRAAREAAQAATPAVGPA